MRTHLDLRRVGAALAVATIALGACGPGEDTTTDDRSPTNAAATTSTRPARDATTTSPPSTARPTTVPIPETTGSPSTTTPVVVPATTLPPTTSSAPSTPPQPPPASPPTTASPITPPITGAGQLDAGAAPDLGPDSEPDSDLTPELPATNAAFDRLAASAEAASITVIRDGWPIMRRATGHTLVGEPITSDTRMVVASVSKLLTAIGLSRLAQGGPLDLDEPVPWAFLGLQPHPGWNDVTPRDLLGHAAGMPVVRTSWFTGEGDCAQYLPALVAGAPRGHRGTWTYSNGNYCALGRLVEFLTGQSLDRALDDLVFEPAGLRPARLTTDGQLLDEVTHRRGVDRLSRLGGAGALIVSTDSVAGALAALTPADYESLRWPGGFIDQYGFGHTGTVGGAVACAWVMEGGRTVMAMTISGERPATGGAICDAIEPALGSDLGFHLGTPTRSSI